MEISYFKEFAILAETKNYWVAAERLFIGQSVLSKHIKNMEKSLGAPLFERTSRKVELTDFGKKMLPYAQSIAKLQFEYEFAADQYLKLGHETLEIASIPVIPHYNITDILIKFQLNVPNVQVNIQEADTLLLRKWLMERKCELIFYRDSVAYLEHDPDLEMQMVKLPYCEDHLVVVLPADHPLANREQVELTELSEEYFALIKQGSMPYTLAVRACREAGFTPSVLFTSHSLEAVLDMVTKGSCAALLFSNHVASPRKTTADQKIAAVPIYPPIKTTVYLAYRRNDPLSLAAEKFISYCMETATVKVN